MDREAWGAIVQVQSSPGHKRVRNDLATKQQKTTSGNIIIFFLIPFTSTLKMTASVFYTLQVEINIAREISITSDMQMTPPLWQKVKRN